MNTLKKNEIFSNIHWELLSNHRVVIWDACHQPKLEDLTRFVSPQGLIYASSINHMQRKKEWMATRALSGFLTGHEPTESNVGVPTWTDGWLGSITHKSGHVGLWVLRDPDLICGIDLEDCREFEWDLAEKVMTAEEISLSLKSIQRYSGSLIFAAKEAIYKALCPIVGKKFYFEAVYLTEVLGGSGDYILKFVVAENLAPAITRGSVLYVTAKNLHLSDGFYWLALAFFPRFRQNRP